MSVNKTLVIYVFHKLTPNVEHFFNNAIFKDDNIDFLIVCNSISLKLSLPIKDYVKILKRENIGYDFGAWSDGLLNNDLYNKHNIFLSCIPHIFTSLSKGHISKNPPSMYRLFLYSDLVNTIGTVHE